MDRKSDSKKCSAVGISGHSGCGEIYIKWMAKIWEIACKNMLEHPLGETMVYHIFSDSRRNNEKENWSESSVD